MCERAKFFPLHSKNAVAIACMQKGKVYACQHLFRPTSEYSVDMFRYTRYNSTLLRLSCNSLHREECNETMPSPLERGGKGCRIRT